MQNVTVVNGAVRLQAFQNGTNILRCLEFIMTNEHGEDTLPHFAQLLFPELLRLFCSPQVSTMKCTLLILT